MSVREEFEGAEFGDKRLSERILKLSECFSRRHGGSISFSCPDWKMAKSAYRFFDNAKVTESSILEPLIKATQARVCSIAEEKILVIHDTTECHYTHHKKTEGLGYLSEIHKVSSQDEKVFSRGFLMHTSLASTTDGVPLGVLNKKIWIRKDKNLR